MNTKSKEKLRVASLRAARGCPELDAVRSASVPFVPDHLESAFNLIEEMNGGHAAVVWLRSRVCLPSVSEIKLQTCIEPYRLPDGGFAAAYALLGLDAKIVAHLEIKNGKVIHPMACAYIDLRAFTASALTEFNIAVRAL